MVLVSKAAKCSSTMFKQLVVDSINECSVGRDEEFLYTNNMLKENELGRLDTAFLHTSMG